MIVPGKIFLLLTSPSHFKLNLFDKQLTFKKVLKLDLLGNCQTFLFSQVKRCAIITYKHGIYELPHEFPNHSETENIRKLRDIGKVSEFYRMIASYPVFLPKSKHS